jgi:hypothetical protein
VKSKIFCCCILSISIGVFHPSAHNHNFSAYSQKHPPFSENAPTKWIDASYFFAVYYTLIITQSSPKLHIRSQIVHLD